MSMIFHQTEIEENLGRRKAEVGLQRGWSPVAVKIKDLQEFSSNRKEKAETENNSPLKAAVHL